MTWNLQGSHRPDLEEVGALIRGFGADVACLQEVWNGQAAQLAAVTGLEHRFWSMKHQPFGPFLRSRAEGMAVLSRFPLASTGSELLTPHAPGWHSSRRILQHAAVPTLGVSVVNVHLSSHSQTAARQVQAARIGERFGRAGGVVVAGDFNAAGEPDLWAQLDEAGLIDRWDPSRGAGFTCRAGRADQRLDRVLTTADLSVTSMEVPADGPVWARRSDHLPVVAHFA